MASYKKYIMMGVTTILIPIAKMAFTKIKSRYTQGLEHGSEDEEDEEFTLNRRPSERRAG